MRLRRSCQQSGSTTRTAWSHTFWPMPARWQTAAFGWSSLLWSEMLARDGTDLEWVDTAVQLADALTKLDAERGFLRNALSSGFVSVRVSARAAESKAAIRAARHRRADAAREARALKPLECKKSVSSVS